MIVRFFCDGACGPTNPGRMAIGVAMVDDKDEVLATISRAIGDGTNQVAEISAVEAALELARERRIERPAIFTDSEFTVKGVSGEYNVTNERLAPMMRCVRAKLAAANGTLQWVPREQNTIADALSKAPLRKSIFYLPVTEVIVQARLSLKHLQNDADLRKATDFIVGSLEQAPEVVTETLRELRIGRSRHSVSPLEVARFDAGLRHGKDAVAELEAALGMRSPATRLKALRWAARGFAPVLAAAKLAIEKAATEPYRLRGSAKRFGR